MKVVDFVTPNAKWLTSPNSLKSLENLFNMKTIGIILGILIAIVLQIPLMIVYFRPEQKAIDFWMIVAIFITSFFSQLAGHKFYYWFTEDNK